MLKQNSLRSVSFERQVDNNRSVSGVSKIAFQEYPGVLGMIEAREYVIPSCRMLVAWDSIKTGFP